MADVIKKSTNKFTKGLVMDFSPENTRNEVLTHALNATLLTFNGNELSLQNDMGNARVETAYLPEGYIPVGTCEYGGIIYIVSYNPLEDKSQIGCFPSPERNVSNDELGKSEAVIKTADFQYLIDELHPSGKIKNNSQYVLLKENHLNPGDKFLVCADDSIFEESLTDLYKQNGVNTEPVANPVLALNVVSIEDSGKIVYLNSDLRQYQVSTQGNTFSYHILGQNSNGAKFDQTTVDIDSYRNAVSSGYNVFKSKTSGRLALLAELVMIDSYAVTHSLRPTKDSDGNTIPGQFDIFIHTEVTPNLTEANFITAPKLSYYYLPESQGYLQRAVGELGSGETEQVPLFIKSNSNDWGFNNDFFNTDLTQVYTSTMSDFKVSGKVSDSSNFGFYFPETYSGTMVKYTGDLQTTFTTYLKVLAHHYYRIDASQVNSVISLKSKLYIYNANNGDVRFTEIQADDVQNYTSEQLFFSPYQDLYLPTTALVPNVQYNYLDGYVTPADIRDGESAISLYYLADFIPQNTGHEITQYEDFKLGHITLPEIAVNNDLDFPFKYKYTLIPCMNYGQLEHLAISNTVDFSQLHAFNHSQFNTWKYHIDGNQLRVTFGAEIFDTYEDDKVDGLVLEFYDLWGFAGSLEITDKKSYSGVFTKILTLNSPNILSNKRVVDSTYSTTYAHNVAIVSDGDMYWLGDREVFWDPIGGWYYGEDSDGNKEGVANDCGTLYSNIMYGVKTYLRQKTADGGYKFTRKKDLFLFTLPIYNEFYYTTNNFSALEYPTLDLILTYKITDSSDIMPYTSSEIIDGYSTNTDYPAVSEYLKGVSSAANLSGTRYYKYTGTSNVYLEIGLKQEYQQYGLSYLADINKLFSCKLQLISNEDVSSTFSVNSAEGISALNYKEDSGLSKQSSYVLFNGNADTKTITAGEFNRYNFINNPTTQSIPITYEFVVGYPFTVSDIQSKQVPVTTMCALLHKNDKGVYNFDDFGLYDTSDDPSNPIYLTKTMYVNGKYATQECFGIAKQVKTTGTVADQYLEVEYTTQNAKCWTWDQTTKLNTENPLRTATDYIGKLTFAQAHAHSTGETDCGINIRCDSEKDGVPIYTIVPGIKFMQKVGAQTSTSAANNDDTAGSIPYTIWYNNPLYNLVANTKGTFNYSEFVSTIDFEATTGIIEGFDYNNWNPDNTSDYWKKWGEIWENQPMRRFVGFTGEELTTFHGKLLETMRHVYAYNPDYPTANIKAGRASVASNPVTFVSNLICSDSELKFAPGESFNDYICFGSISVNKYLQSLQKYSGYGSDLPIKVFDKGNAINAVNFSPNYTYLGSSSNPYLITALTYNTQTPTSLVDVLEIKTNSVCVRHEDATYTFLEGDPNQNLLYGFSSDYKKLVQLDVSNYSINQDGSVIVTDKVNYGNHICTLPLTEDTFSQIFSDDGYNSTYDFQSTQFGNSTCEYNLTLELPAECMSRNNSKAELFYIVMPRSAVGIRTLSLFNPIFDGFNQSEYSYNATVDSNVEVVACTINDRISDDTLARQTSDTLTALITGDSSDYVEIVNTSGGVTRHQIGSLRGSVLNNVRIQNNTILNAGSVTSRVIYKVTFKNINLNLARYLHLPHTSKEVISTDITADYAETVDHKYTVLNLYNKARLRGTSIVINDLYYTPELTGHRLYLKRDRYHDDQSEDKYRARIFYRSLNSRDTWSFYERDSSGVKRSSKDYRRHNNVFLHTGPCFTLDNLGHADYDN